MPGESDSSWALGHPEKVKDYGYRAIHEMTQLAKATIRAFYGTDPRYSYFEGCSNGGREALMEAQRYPRDYDGILAGAPANYWTHQRLMDNALAPASNHGGSIPATKLPAIARAVNGACDALDGVVDGILNDPRTCHFDPATLLCKNGDSDQCLTQSQVNVLKAIYAGPHDAQGRALYPGLLPGGEEGPGGWGQTIEPIKQMVRGYFSNMVYGNPDWNLEDTSVDEAAAAADAKTAKILNATDPNLSAFKARGGKLILYHGWSDSALSPLNTINYYTGVEQRMGARETVAFTRLYMAPGMQHCFGGPGPNNFGQNYDATEHANSGNNIELALQDWVEKGISPSSIIATKYVEDDPKNGVKMTRPLCPYPQAAMWTGKGSTDDAANFFCKAP
jgi:feruloyl esterase